MAGVTSLSSDQSSMSGMSNPAAVVDFKNLSSNAPGSAVRVSGGGVMMASAFAPPAPFGGGLEQGISNLRWLAQSAKPLVRPALQAMIATAGGAQAFAGQVMTLGRAAAVGVYELAVAVGAAEFAVALGLALGMVALTAEGTGNAELPPELRNRTKPQGGPGNPAAPQGTAPTRTPVPTVAPMPTVKPAAPSAAQAKQNQASAAAISTLTQANTTTPAVYAAVEKFYQIASGGRAARTDGSLRAPMQAVQQQRTALNDAILQSEKQIAASAPQDRAALKGWHDTLAGARNSIDNWLASANAYSAGLNRPGGSRSAQPTLPPPPATVVSAPNSTRSSAQVAQRLAANYQGASDALSRGASRTSPAAPSTPSAPSAAAPDRAQVAAAQSQQARQQLAAADPITQRMNKGVESFYQQAAGGKAARQNGSLAESLRSVTQSKAELNRLILAANKSIAGSSPADQPGFERVRSNLRQARDAIDAWLPAANAFAAGLSGPGGKPSATPALPGIPSVVVGAGGQADKVAAGSMSRAQGLAAGATVKVAGTTGSNEAPITLPGAPKIRFATGDSPPKNAVDVWLNSDSGKVSQTPMTGPGWFQAAMSNADGVLKPIPEDSAIVHLPKPAFEKLKKESLLGRFKLPKLPKPPKPPKISEGAWVVIGLALTGLATQQFGIWQGNQQNAEKARLDGLEQANGADTKLKDFTAPASYKNTAEKADAYYNTWVSYLNQGEQLLKNSRVADQGAVDDGKYIAAFSAEKAKFIKQLEIKRDAVKSSKDVDTANALLTDYLSNPALRFNPANFEPSSLDKYKGRETRPQRCLTAISQAINDKSIASLAGLDKREVTDPIGQTQLGDLNRALDDKTQAPSVPAAPPVLPPKVPPKVPPKTPGMAPPTSSKTSPVVPTPMPAPSAISPGPSRSPTSPAATAKPPVAQPDPAAVARNQAKAAADAQAAKLAKSDQDAAVKGIAQAYASPDVALQLPASLDKLKFTSSMFLTPADRQSPNAIRNAFIRVETLLKKLDSVRLSLRDQSTQTKMYGGLESLAAVTRELKTLHDQVSARKKSEQSTPAPTSTVRPTPAPTPPPPLATPLPPAAPAGTLPRPENNAPQVEPTLTPQPQKTPGELSVPPINQAAPAEAENQG